MPRLAVNSLRLDMHRAPSKGMTQKPDPKAERIKARKERKHSGRRNLTHATLDAVKLILRGRMASIPQSVIATEECPDCQRRQHRSVA